MTRHRVRSTFAIALVAALAGLPAAASAKERPATRAKLVAFDSCRALVGYAQVNARRAGGVGVPMRALGAVPEGLARPVPVSTKGPAAEQDDVSAVAAPGATSFSGTNVQEAGIDEPDVVKTDGKHVYAVASGKLQVLDVTGDGPRVVGTLDLGGGFAHQLLLRGPRALVLSTVSGGIAYADVGPARAAIAPPVPGRSTTVLTEVDLTDPAAPKVARTMTLEGDYVDARMTGGTARVVVSSTPTSAPAPGGEPQPLDGAPLRSFVPATTIKSAITGRTYRRAVVPCDDVRRPDAFSGLGLLSVLTVDLDKGLYDVDRDAVLAGAQTVYGSGESLYVASQRWVPGLRDTTDVPGRMRTEIHRFDASVAGTTSYAGTGTVPGFVVNAYAMSEHDGALRVASTDEPPWLPEGGEPEPAQSYVTVLSARGGGALTQVGQVGGLGKGQRITGVRFAGTTGYVVTFRRTDPLYTVDLTRADAPRVVGELEIPGYSAYLHPLAGGLLLGVGQEATSEGRVQGTQVSVFDVSDLAHPKRVQHLVFGNGSSDAEFDPHAFLWWGPTQTAVLPLSIYDEDGTTGFIGAVGLHAGADRLAEIGRLTHGTGLEAAPIARSFVVGDRLYTLSYAGLQANRLDSFAPVGFAAFEG
jgi:uncharacterized secreted protein with C-terminal beta-propeller domain